MSVGMLVYHANCMLETILRHVKGWIAVMSLTLKYNVFLLCTVDITYRIHSVLFQ